MDGEVDQNLPNILSLNDDVLVTIFTYIREKYLKHIPFINRLFAKLVSNQDFWRRRTELYLNAQFPPLTQVVETNLGAVPRTVSSTEARDWRKIYFDLNDYENHRDPLFEAAQKGWIDLFPVLVDQQKKTCSYYRQVIYDALITASFHNQKEIVKLCLASGDNIISEKLAELSNPRDSFCVPMIWRYDSPIVFMENYKDRVHTPLAAVCLGYGTGSNNDDECLDLIDILLDVGDTPNGWNDEPFLIAIWRGQIGVVQYFLKKSYKIQNEEDVFIAALQPLQDGNIEIRDFLLSSGISTLLPKEIFILICRLSLSNEEYELLEKISRREESRIYLKEIQLFLLCICKSLEMAKKVMCIFPDPDSRTACLAAMELMRNKGRPEVIRHLFTKIEFTRNRTEGLLLNMIKCDYADLAMTMLSNNSVDQFLDKQMMEKILTITTNPLTIRNRLKLLLCIFAHQSKLITGLALGVLLVHIAHDRFLVENVVDRKFEAHFMNNLGNIKKLLRLLFSRQWSIPNQHILVAARICPVLKGLLVKYAPELKKEILDA